MPQNLVIVESPGKIKSIERYLKNISIEPQPDSDSSTKPQRETYKVMSSVGHIRDLPKSGMNVDPENNWAANYEISKDKVKIVNDLRKAAENSSYVYLATDLDREGEAIAWHLKEVIGGDDDRFIRVIFNEITQASIEKAFSNPGRIDENRVNAQQARRLLDRVVGYKLTPLLYKKIARNLSAGRVQSVAVRLVVEREREIRAFRPREYWDIFANLSQEQSHDTRSFQVWLPGEKRFEIPNEEAANKVVEKLSKSVHTVSSVTTKPGSGKANAPFITSTLQQAASTNLGFQVSRTMRLAQRLYEAGLITYMRTDSTSISDEARASTNELIDSKFGKEYRPDKPNEFKSKANAQEAHEAIRPSDVRTEPGITTIPLALGRTSKTDQVQATRLYELIWKRFVASQMSPERWENTTVAVQAGEYELRLTGRRTVFQGYARVWDYGSRKEEPDLPKYEENETLSLRTIEKKQHFTRPPARYSEARLVSELEKRGIGRPSTYASVISTIERRGFISMRGKQMYAERIAEIVTDRLVKSFPNLLNYEFTADMEVQLDEIAIGKRSWDNVLDLFYADFSQKLVEAETGMGENDPIPTDISCEKCERKMNVRIGATGTFLGCSGYQLRGKEKCTHTVDLSSDENMLKFEEDAETESEEDESRRLLAKKECDNCHAWMDGYIVNKNLKLHICGNTIDCGRITLEEGDFKVPGYEGPTHECDKCGSDLQLQKGRFGPFYRCSNDACKNIRKPLPGGGLAALPVPMPELKCEGVDDHYVLREGKAGIFLGASTYPKVRKMRAPSIKELLVHSNEIDPKFQFILDAPTEDDKGNDTFVKFARKNRQHYLTSLREDKDTGWRAFYNDGNWQSKAK